MKEEKINRIAKKIISSESWLEPPAQPISLWDSFDPFDKHDEGMVNMITDIENCGWKIKEAKDHEYDDMEYYPDEKHNSLKQEFQATETLIVQPNDDNAVSWKELIETLNKSSQYNYYDTCYGHLQIDDYYPDLENEDNEDEYKLYIIYYGNLGYDIDDPYDYDYND